MRIALIFCLLSLVAPTSADDQIELSAQQIENLGIRLAAPTPAGKIPLLNAPGEVVVPPAGEQIVSAPQTGLINQLHVATGDSVKKGQLLAEINSPELLNLQRQFLQAQSHYHLAYSQYQRDKKLLDEGVIADRRWQESKASHQAESAKLSEARQLLRIAGMSAKDIESLAKTRRLNSRLNVYAPLQGIVLERLATTGERVEILMPLYRIANPEELWLEISVPQEQVTELQLGDEVLLGQSGVKAHITLLGRHVEPHNQTVLVRALIDKPTAQIRVGQALNTQIIQRGDDRLYQLPNSAIVLRENQAYIFIRDAQGFTVHPVNIRGKRKQLSVIDADFRADAEIAVQGAVALKAKWMGLGESEE